MLKTTLDLIEYAEHHSKEEIRNWIVDRLHRRDSLAILDGRTGELPHTLFISLYSQLEPEAQSRVRLAIKDLLPQLLEGDWKGEPADSLLLIVGEIIPGSPEQELIARQLLRFQSHVRSREQQIQGKNEGLSDDRVDERYDLNFRLAQTLVNLGVQYKPNKWTQFVQNGGENYANLAIRALGSADPFVLSAWLQELQLAHLWTDNLENALLTQLPLLIDRYPPSSDLEFFGQLESLPISENAAQVLDELREDIRRRI